MNDNATNPRNSHPAAEHGLKNHLHPSLQRTRTDKDLPPLGVLPGAKHCVNNGAQYQESHRTATNCQGSPRQWRKLKFPPNPDGNSEVNGHHTGQESSQFRPNQPSALTPRGLGLGVTSSPVVLRRRRLQSSVSLDGSPIVGRRTRFTVHDSPAHGSPTCRSPRIVRSASLCRGGPNDAEVGHMTLARTTLIRSRSLNSVETKGQLLDFTDLTLAAKIRSSECGISSSDNSEGSSQVLRAMSGLQVVAEENIDERRLAPGSKNGTRKINDPLSGSSTQHDVHRPEGAAHMENMSGVGDSAMVDPSDQVPEYQKAPISTETRIAQWLQGLERTGLEPVDEREDRTQEEKMFPEIVKR